MDKELALGYILTGTQTIFTTIQDNQVFQVIQMILSILSGIVVIVYTVWKWYKKAKSDGKISHTEIEEGIDELIDALDYMNKNKEGDE